MSKMRLQSRDHLDCAVTLSAGQPEVNTLAMSDSEMVTDRKVSMFS